MTTSFAERASEGDALGTIRYGMVNGALWAIGIAWSNAIRETLRALLPEDVLDVVVAELVAATLTTVLGAGVAIAATRKNWCGSSVSPCERGESAKGCVNPNSIPSRSHTHH